MKKILLIFGLIFIPSLILAQASLELDYPGLDPDVTLEEFILFIFNFVFGLFGLFIFILLLITGFSYITSFGDPNKNKKARKRIKSSLIAFFLFLFSFLLFYTINPDLVTLKLTDLGRLARYPLSYVTPPTIDDPDLIMKEIPIGKIIEFTLRKEDYKLDNPSPDIQPLGKIEKLVEGIEDLLTREIKVTLPSFFTTKDTFYRIADVNKYLKNLTEHCKASNLIAICTESESGSRPQGCQGDVCLLNQNDTSLGGLGVRPNMNEVININVEQKIKHDAPIPTDPSTMEDGISFDSLLQIPPKIKAYTEEYQTRVNKLVLALEEMTAGQNTLMTLYEYFDTKEVLLSRGMRSAQVPLFQQELFIPTIPSYGPDGQITRNIDSLTFYHIAGGNLVDESPWLDIEGSASDTFLDEEDFFSFNCPFVIPLGQLADETLRVANLIIIKTESLTPIINEKVAAIGELSLLANSCNESQVSISCGGIRNPCYRRCHRPWCACCCRSINLQTGGGCFGEACPRDEIEAAVDKIKELEDEIFIILNEIKELIEITPYLLGELEQYIEVDGKRFLTGYFHNLFNSRQGASLCLPSDPESPWEIISCREAKNSIGPDGNYIINCNPRDFYCCGYSGDSVTPTIIDLPASVAREIVPRRVEYPVKSYDDINSGECPNGWECDSEITQHPQYKDASLPIKQHLDCMRNYLDSYQSQQEISEKTLKGLNTYNKIGRLSAITDHQLYINTSNCDWIEGGEDCSHTFVFAPTTEQGLRVSGHYGGPFCRARQESYAISINLSRPYEKMHAKTIVDAALACDSNSFISYTQNQLYIGLAASYNCGTN